MAAPFETTASTVRSAPPPAILNTRVIAEALPLRSTETVPEVPPEGSSTMKEAALPDVVTSPLSTNLLPSVPAPPRRRLRRLFSRDKPPLPTVMVDKTVPLLPYKVNVLTAATLPPAVAVMSVRARLPKESRVPLLPTKMVFPAPPVKLPAPVIVQLPPAAELNTPPVMVRLPMVSVALN